MKKMLEKRNIGLEGIMFIKGNLLKFNDGSGCCKFSWNCIFLTWRMVVWFPSLGAT